MAFTWPQPPPQARVRMGAASGRWPGTRLPDLRDARVSADGTARLAGVAVCAADGTAGAFLPGQTAQFCFEFETLQSLEAPIGGLEIRDASGLVIHGRTSLQDGAAVPMAVAAGSRLRFRQTLRLDLAPGDYWFSVGLSSADQRAMASYRGGSLTHMEMDRAMRTHCRADGLGPFLIGYAPSGKLLHYGLVNLPGSWEVGVVPRSPLAGARASNVEDMESPGLAQRALPDAPRLIYLASYPRSGNTWVRNLVEFTFDRLTSTAHDEGTGEDGRGPLVQYRNNHPPVLDRRRLAQGCGPLLNDRFRRQLAGGEEHYFVKTHELPFGEFFGGEGAVYIVRHPAGSLWSYYNYLRQRGHAVRLEEVIEGAVPFGSWSRHVDAWLDAGRGLGPRLAVLRYETLGSDEALACHLMARLTGLPRRSVVPFPGFSYWHQGDPDFYRSGGDEWRTHLTADQLRLVRRLHSGAAERLGYEV